MKPSAYILACAALASVPVFAGITDTASLKGGGPLYRKVYYIDSNLTLGAGSGASPLAVMANTEAIIYIPAGVTLTVTGGDGSGTTGGGAGICVPATSTLIVTGEGTLVAKGGKAGAGSGGSGGNGASVSKSKAKSGGGGAGGDGGGGAAAAIGGNGGSGGSGGASRPTTQVDDDDGYTKERWQGTTNGGMNQDGHPGAKGKDGGTSGKVYLLGTVKVILTAGGPNSGGSGGNASGHDYGEWTNDWFGGGGGGGGGGTGSNFVSDDWDDYYDEKPYVGGGGGIGGYSGSGDSYNGKKGSSADKDSFTKASNDDVGPSGTVYRHQGGAGGPSGAAGDSGMVYMMDDVELSQTGSDSTVALYYQSSTVTAGPAAALYTIKFINASDSTDAVNVTLGCGYPVHVPALREGYEFRGYYTGRNGTGTRYYDENGDPEPSLGVYATASDLTLYASWTIEGRTDEHIVVKAGTEMVLDGLIDSDTQILYQPSSGNLITVERGAKLLVKNFLFQGSDTGMDSVFYNEGTLFVSNCVFRENFAPYGWGSAYRDHPGASATFYGCTFRDNSAVEGGAIAAEGSKVSVVYSTFTGNVSLMTAPDQPGGAAIYAIDGAKLNLVGCTFVANSTSSNGSVGAFYNCDSSSVVLNNVFADSQNLAVKTGTIDYATTNNVYGAVGVVLGDQLERIENGVRHFVRRPLGIARTTGFAENLYRSADWMSYSRGSKSGIGLPILYDQLDEHVLEGWAGAIAGNTLQHLINTTPVGGTLTVPGGVYDPVFVNKQIVIQAAPDELCAIDAYMLEPCVEMHPGAEDAVWDGFAFIYGKGTGNGGGIAYTGNSNVKAGFVSNCVFSACTAQNGGGAACLKVASMCSFTNCVAKGDGGATWSCSLVDRSYYWNNIAATNGGASYADAMVRSSFLRYNQAQKGGTGNMSTFYNCTIADSVANEAQTAYHSTLVGCALYNNGLPTDDFSVNHMKATAQLKRDRFYDVPHGDFHLRIKNISGSSRTKVDQSDLCVSDVDSLIARSAYQNGWLDLEGNPLVTVNVVSGSMILYGGCYAFSPYKASGLVVNGADEWYDNTNAKTSLREAVETAVEDPTYNTNEVCVITFSPEAFPEDSVTVLSFEETQIDLSVFTNRLLVISGPTNAVVEINGGGEFRALRVRAGNTLRLENLVFRNCLGSEFGKDFQPGSNGGAIINHGNLVVSNCVFVANSAGRKQTSTPIGFGGAISTEVGASTTVFNSSFDGNVAARGGALYVASGGAAHVFMSTFGRNIANGASTIGAVGGAIDSASPDLWLVNTAVVGNSVPSRIKSGGGVSCKSGAVLLDSVVFGNTSGGVTNDIAFSANASGSFTNSFCYTAYGSRSDEGTGIAFWDFESVQTDMPGDFVATTNAVDANVRLPHIVYPISDSCSRSAAMAWVNLSGGAVGFYNSSIRRVQAIVGESRVLSRGEELSCDQIANHFANGIFGACSQIAPSDLPYTEDDEGDEEEEDPTPDEPDPPVPVADVVIVDAFGVTNYFDSLEYGGSLKALDAALSAFRAGDTLAIVSTNDATAADLAEELFWTDNDNFVSNRNFIANNDLFDIAYEDYDLVFATSLNAAARPVAGMPDLKFREGFVAVTPTNIFAGLWYTLGGSANIRGPFVAHDWCEAFAPDDSHSKPWLNEPLLAPTNGPTGFYRVFVAPYAPSE